MKTFTVTKPQSVRDLAIQLYGSTQFTFKLANDNGLELDGGVVVANTQIIYDETIGDKRTRDAISNRGYSISNIVEFSGAKTPLNGYLYNYYASQLTDFNTITDFSIPSVDELNTLKSHLATNQGGKMKIVDIEYWNLPNTGATNESGFTALGSGIRLFRSDFIDQKNSLYMMTTTPEWSFGIANDNGNLTLTVRSDGRGEGISIRMIYTGTGTPPAQVTDYDGNIYDVIQIGTQYWLKQNYACTHLADGTPINKITDGASWTADTTGAYCAYDNDESNVFV